MTVHLKLILLMLQLRWIISFSKSPCQLLEINLELAPRLQSRVLALLPPPSPSMQQNKIVSETKRPIPIGSGAWRQRGALPRRVKPLGCGI